mgnify:CR=1 FL=1
MTVLTCDPNLQEKQDFFSAIARKKESLHISVPVFDPLPASTVVIYTIFFVNYSKIKLLKPIKLVYERGAETGAYIIGNEEFNKYGIGKTKEDALKEFEQNVVSDYFDLKMSDHNKLTQDAKDLLTIYGGYFQSEHNS